MKALLVVVMAMGLVATPAAGVRDAFNAAVDCVRVVAIVSPT